MKLFIFIARYYLRYFVIIFIALGGFFVSVDSLQYIDNFTDSANLVILFFVYDFLYAMNFTLPIALLLATTISYVFFIKSNQFTALLALGYSKRDILFPMLCLSIGISCCHIALNATPFAYAQEKVEKFFAKDASAPTTDLFVKYNNDYVYFGSVNLLRQAHTIRVFALDSAQNLAHVIQAKDAIFEENSWRLYQAITQSMPPTWQLGDTGLVVKQFHALPILANFNPKVLDSFSQTKPAISIIDALHALRLLQEQRIGSEKIRAVLYALIIVPLFVPFVMMILTYYTPSLSRYGNLYLLGFLFIVLSLLLWGMFYSLSQFAITGVVLPELGVLVPFAMLVVIGLSYYMRINTSL